MQKGYAMSLKIRSGYAILTASVLGLMTGCGEGASDGMEMEPEVISDVQQEPESSVLQQEPEETFEVQAARTPPARGSFDGVWGGRAYGWACAPRFPRNQVKIQVEYNNGRRFVTVGRGDANLYRADIVGLCGGNGAFGFSIPISTNNLGGYRVFAVTAGGILEMRNDRTGGR